MVRLRVNRGWAGNISVVFRPVGEVEFTRRPFDGLGNHRKMNNDMTTKIISVCVELFSALLSAGATIFAACVAIYGINAWRREFKGKRDIELAEEVLELFYKARDAIRAIRSPFGFSNEGKKVIERMKAEGKEGDIDLRMATVLERYESREKTFQKLGTLHYRFMARFGKDKTKPFDDIRECVNKIFNSAQMLSILNESIKEGGLKEEDKESQREEMNQFMADLYWGDEKRDRITPKIDAVIREMEEICQKIVGGG